MTVKSDPRPDISVLSDVNSCTGSTRGPGAGNFRSTFVVLSAGLTSMPQSRARLSVLSGFDGRKWLFQDISSVDDRSICATTATVPSLTNLRSRSAKSNIKTRSALIPLCCTGMCSCLVLG